MEKSNAITWADAARRAVEMRGDLCRRSILLFDVRAVTADLRTNRPIEVWRVGTDLRPIYGGVFLRWILCSGFTSQIERGLYVESCGATGMSDFSNKPKQWEPYFNVTRLKLDHPIGKTWAQV
ncbi:unnamed protein product, partial [Iphiclides podalirius]